MVEGKATSHSSSSSINTNRDGDDCSSINKNKKGRNWSSGSSNVTLLCHHRLVAAFQCLSSISSSFTLALQSTGTLFVVLVLAQIEVSFLVLPSVQCNTNGVFTTGTSSSGLNAKVLNVSEES